MPPRTVRVRNQERKEGRDGYLEKELILLEVPTNDDNVESTLRSDNEGPGGSGEMNGRPERGCHEKGRTRTPRKDRKSGKESG